jgi:hypothetical protein
MSNPQSSPLAFPPSDVMRAQHGERLPFAWIAYAFLFIASFRVYLGVASTGSLPQILAQLWRDAPAGGIGNMCFWYAGGMLVLDVVAVLASRRPHASARSRAFLAVLLGLSLCGTCLYACAAPLISDEPSIRWQLFLQHGAFFGLISAVQWFSMKAARERV